MSHLERRLELQAKGVNVQTSLSPVERSYLDALNTARVDPEAGIAKFQAMIDLFESPKDDSGPNRALHPVGQAAAERVPPAVRGPKSGATAISSRSASNRPTNCERPIPSGPTRFTVRC